MDVHASAVSENDREPLVRVEGLTRRFGERLAVAELSFEVGRGELFGLVGPDGAGKTTTLRMLAGVLRPSAGDAWIGGGAAYRDAGASSAAGRDALANGDADRGSRRRGSRRGASVAREPEAVKRHLAYMSQRFGLYTDLTVRENLAFYADLYDVPRRELPARLERLFAFSGLGPFQDRLAGQLSGGMKQKLGLSCALVHEPELLLLDEPTFGVDPVSRRELWRIVHERVAEGVTAIVSTAYLDEAERFDRVALLHEGRLLALDTPEGLQRSLDEEVLEVRVDEPQRAREVLRSLPGESGGGGLVRRATAYGARLHVAVEPPAERAAAAVEAALREAGIEPGGIEQVPPSLEDVFLARVEAPPAERATGAA
ncbi:MAG TPA: ABC transporter ATP-binding protein [Thermoanaerobaculia bacterium]|nr:ABC transporter ATP-binding protein [Thermoanaerobaculia bacterium]